MVVTSSRSVAQRILPDVAGPTVPVSLVQTAVTSSESDYLTFVGLRDGALSVRFADGYTGTVDPGQVELDVSHLKLTSLRASSWGSAAEVEDVSGETIHIDSSVLRACVDPVYATHLQQMIDQLEE